MKIQFSSRSAALLVATLIAGTPSPSNADDPPAVTTILAQMRLASGGDAWSSISRLHVVMTSRDGGEVSELTQWDDVTNGRYRTIVTKTGATRQSGFDGVTSWTQGRSGIAYTLGDVDSALVSANESFRVARAWWFRDRHAATIAYAGVRSDHGRSFDVLAVTPEAGRSFEAWVDRSTHLLDRIDEQQAEDRVVTTYGDYRPVDGIIVPFSIRSGDGEDPSFDEIETVQSVEINPAVTDSLYAIPPRPVSDIELPPGRDSIEVPFRLTSNNRILVSVTLNDGATVDADFDSGGSLILQPANVAKLGIASEGHHKQSGGGEGSTTSSTGKLSVLRIGEARIRNLQFHSFAFNANEPDEALVGLEILQRFVVCFDFDRLVMTLTKPDAFRYVGSGAVVPFHFQDNQPEVKGSIDGIAGLFAIDTGDDSSLLLIAPFAQRYGLVDRYRADIPYGGTAVGATHGMWARTHVHSVLLNGADGRPVVEAHDPVTRISLQHSGFDANRNVSANIGLGILKQFNLTFDYLHQRLIFEPNHLFGKPDFVNRTGFKLTRKDAAWAITAVYPDSPAAAAELKVGDEIEAIDGRPIDALTVDALVSTLKEPEGTVLKIQVKSGSEMPSVKLALKKYVLNLLGRSRAFSSAPRNARTGVSAGYEPCELLTQQLRS